MAAALEAETTKLNMLPDVSSLEEVTALRVEVVNVSAANLIRLDVTILGCTKGKDIWSWKIDILLRRHKNGWCVVNDFVSVSCIFEK